MIPLSRRSNLAGRYLNFSAGQSEIFLVQIYQRNNAQAEAEARKKETGGQASDKRLSKRARDREKDPNLPKRPQNPFFQFCKVKLN